MTKRLGAALVLCLFAGLGMACVAEEEPGRTGTGGTTGSAGTGNGSTGAAGTGTAAGTAGTTGAAGTGSSAGTAGTTGAAGTGSSAGTAGTTGAGGAGTAGTGGGAGSSGLPGAVKSDGCGMEPGQALMTHTKYSIMVAKAPVNFQPRDFYAWLPANYDKNRAYPTIFVGPGCGGSGNNTIPVNQATGDKAIIIGLQASPKSTNQGCFMTESPTSTEIDYFDEALKQVEAKFCVDKSRVFLEGFSSGSWLTNLIGCARGNLLKGQGNASGCTPPLPTCTGPIAMMGVTNEPDQNNSYGCGTSNRDRIAKLNGCTTQTMAYNPGPMVTAKNGGVLECVQYMGCMPGKPVVWCRTTNLGHNDGANTGISTFGFWDFWMSLP